MARRPRPRPVRVPTVGAPPARRRETYDPSRSPRACRASVVATSSKSSTAGGGTSPRSRATNRYAWCHVWVSAVAHSARCRSRRAPRSPSARTRYRPARRAVRRSRSRRYVSPAVTGRDRQASTAARCPTVAVTRHPPPASRRYRHHLPRRAPEHRAMHPKSLQIGHRHRCAP